MDSRVFECLFVEVAVVLENAGLFGLVADDNFVITDVSVVDLAVLVQLFRGCTYVGGQQLNRRVRAPQLHRGVTSKHGCAEVQSQPHSRRGGRRSILKLSWSRGSSDIRCAGASRAVDATVAAMRANSGMVMYLPLIR